ncbi:hypothetical protein [Stratiformator vulcanicus]|uniref:Uncharacterized protein n=1 Tax=Stratiformator vulcanicus TaxID=2527980 RepID=A0A517R747_9PLAN|nr:hypothetical protein [Stratiformator vulcanicus]QDT39708.1 hypothetical protein Pan189_41170 [Stratiformator vulcanicus]
MRSLFAGALLLSAALSGIGFGMDADPFVSDDACSIPSATCGNAIPSDAGMPGRFIPADGAKAMSVSVTQTCSKTNSEWTDVGDSLRSWSNASKTLFPVTSAERLRLAYQHANCSGHELSLLAELRGPVDVAELGKQYRWEKGESDRTLVGRPTDSMERLFVDRFEVTLDEKTNLPTSVKVWSRRTLGDENTFALDTATRPTHFTQVRPPANPIRFASAEAPYMAAPTESGIVTASATDVPPAPAR